MCRITNAVTSPLIIRRITIVKYRFIRGAISASIFLSIITVPGSSIDRNPIRKTALITHRTAKRNETALSEHRRSNGERRNKERVLNRRGDRTGRRAGGSEDASTVTAGKKEGAYRIGENLTMITTKEFESGVSNGKNPRADGELRGVIPGRTCVLIPGLLPNL